MIYSIGRVCLKIAGRDAGKKCVIIDEIDNNRVLIDGETRRRKVNLKHLEPTKFTFEINKGESHEKIIEILSKKNWDIRLKKPKKAAPKPKKIKKQKKKPETKPKTQAKPKETTPKKEEKKSPVKKETKPEVKKEETKPKAAKKEEKK